MVRPGRKPRTYSQATRLLRVLDQLQARHYGTLLEQLARENDVSERQMRRDLRAIEAAGFPIDLDVTAEGRTMVLLGKGRPRPVNLTLGERLGLLAARRVFDVVKDTPLGADLQQAYFKIAGTLPQDGDEEPERLADRFAYVPDVGAKRYPRRDVLQPIFDATLRRRRLSARYRPIGGAAGDRLLLPYALALYKHGLYLIAGRADAERRAEAPHVYAVERFERAEVLRGDPVEVPAGFSVERFFEGAFGLWVGGPRRRVVIDFEEPAADRILSRVWHPAQKTQTLPGGRVRLSFEAGNLTEVHSWALSWGPLARVREPAELVASVRKDLAEAAKAYRG